MKTCKIIVLMFFLFCLSCQKDAGNQIEIEDPIEIEVESNDLVGTKWKLFFIYDHKPNYAYYHSLEPRDCVECYTLTFDSDYTATMFSIIDSFTLDLSQLNPIQLTDFSYVKRVEEDGDDDDGMLSLIYRSLTSSQFYYVMHDELVFYSLNYSMFFKPFDGLTTNIEPTYLAGTKWKCVGVASVETGEIIREFEPKDCEECYTLTFKTDYIAESRQINSIGKFDLYYRMYHPKNVTFACEAILSCENYDKDGICYYDTSDYGCELHMVTSYKATDNELKLFSEYHKYSYLLYKLIDK